MAFSYGNCFGRSSGSPIQLCALWITLNSAFVGPTTGTAALLKDHSIQIRFESADALRQEFEKNIANRGIFVATEVEFSVRSAIDVEVVLEYVDAKEVALSLRGEVVHCVALEMAASGAMPGVAIQFDDTARELCEAFEPLLQAPTAPQSPIETPGADSDDPAAISASALGLDISEIASSRRERRGVKRHAVRVPVRMMPTLSAPFEATSRDLSATGILLTIKAVALPVGEVVRTCLWHPSGEPSIEIDGRVVREVKNKSGRIAAVAIAFDRDQASDPRTNEVIEAIRQAGHRSRLGGISGSIVDLGLANMLEMFGCSALRGTLIVERDGEQGWIAFADAQMLAAELGALSGHDALVAMLDWGEGRFHFEATADEKLIEQAARRPLEAAVFEAARTLDERAEAASVGEGQEPVVIDDATTFLVDAEREARARSSLEKADEVVLELAKTGMTAARLKSIIPESSESIQSALEGLLELGILIPR